MAAAKKTHIETLIEKDYIGSWHVADRDHTLVIERVEKKQITMRGGKKKWVPVLSFRGVQKKMILQARTNRETISDMYGPYIEDWIGKSVSLFMDPNCKNPNGKGVIPGVRIRPMVPKGPPDTTLPERPVDPDMRAAQNEAFAEQPDEREPGAEG